MKPNQNPLQSQQDADKLKVQKASNLKIKNKDLKEMFDEISSCRREVEAVADTQTTKIQSKRDKKALRKQQQAALNSSLKSPSSSLHEQETPSANQELASGDKRLETLQQSSVKKSDQKSSKDNQATPEVIRKATIMQNLDRVDGACEYFYILEKENEEILEANIRTNKSNDHSSEASREPHEMPKGYPQKLQYKPPKVDKVQFQIEVESEVYRGDKSQYEAFELQVYSNQQRDCLHKRQRRSNSIQIDSLRINRKPSDERRLHRVDELYAPSKLNEEPLQKFISDRTEERYTRKELDEYLEFCEFVMRSAPVQGNYCGILLRGSHMFKENAYKLLNEYDYNFNLAKFHILYPLVMVDPLKKCQVVLAAKQHPEEFNKEVQNAIIDLQGCKKDEINEILDKFRADLASRINEEQLKYHLTALKKIRVQTPADIEDKIKKSLDFSKEIRKKCNMQGSQNKAQLKQGTSNLATDKKLKMSELIELNEEQKQYCFITQEMIMLEQLLDKAWQWQAKAESLKSMDVIHYRSVESVYQDGKSIPVNFQELMQEVKQFKVKAENLNNRIQDAIIVKKTRMRVGELKKSAKRQEIQTQEREVEVNDDKEQEFRALLEEARQMKLQSEQISKLSAKVADIDKWKQEVQLIFDNVEEEAQNYKRFQVHYKSLLARSSVFQIELAMMKQMQRKCVFIDWREKVEELHQKLENVERITIDQIKGLLDEGVDKEFLGKQAQQYAPFAQDQREDPVAHMFINFDALAQILQIFEQAVQFDSKLKRALKIIENSQSNSSSSESVISGDLASSPEDITEFDSVEKLNELLSQEHLVRIEVVHLKEFKVKLKELTKAEERCNSLISQYSQPGSSEFHISSKQEFETLIKAMAEFESQNITCSSFKVFGEKMQSFVSWLSEAQKLIKSYCKALGVKSTQISYIDISLLKSSEQAGGSSLEVDTNFAKLKHLCEQLLLPKYEIFNSSEEGSLLRQILEKTVQLKEQFYEMKNEKRSATFDQVKYFKLLENFQSSGLPEETSVIEEARIELKREKWIKKFNDLQQVGKQLAAPEIENQSVMSSQNNQSPEKAASGHVRIKTVDILIKEYQQSKELNEHGECQMIFDKLAQQQLQCQRWLERFNACFNSEGIFDPKGGQQTVNELLQVGQALELKLKEFVDLQMHQKETSEWNLMTDKIFDGTRSVTLDQLKKHIKDTNDIGDNNSQALLGVLESLKETTTFWKILANTIFKIRPIENFPHIVLSACEAKNNASGTNSPKELFCICRQPENGSLMLCCDYCDMWYHYTCIGLLKDLKLEKVKYKCIGCSIRQGQFNPISQTFKEADAEQSADTQIQEIETTLLDLFLVKKRIREQDFQFVISQGKESIPLHLEEMPQLEYINHSIARWKEQVTFELLQGAQLKDLIQNFKKLNQGLLEKTIKQQTTQAMDQFKHLQLREKDRDDNLHLLVIQSQSFPIVMSLEVQLITLLRFRDWLRECLLVYVQANTKVIKLSKHFKHKSFKAIKRLVQTGDDLISFSAFVPKEEVDSVFAALQGQILQVQEIMKLLLKNKGVGSSNLEAFEKIGKGEVPHHQLKTEMKVSIELDESYGSESREAKPYPNNYPMASSLGQPLEQLNSPYINIGSQRYSQSQNPQLKTDAGNNPSEPRDFEANNPQLPQTQIIMAKTQAQQQQVPSSLQGNIYQQFSQHQMGQAIQLNNIDNTPTEQQLVDFQNYVYPQQNLLSEFNLMMQHQMSQNSIQDHFEQQAMAALHNQSQQVSSQFLALDEDIKLLQQVVNELQQRIQSAGSSMQDPYLNQWLIETAEFTSRIANFGNCDQNVTLELIREGQEFLDKFRNTNNQQ